MVAASTQGSWDRTLVVMAEVYRDFSAIVCRTAIALFSASVYRDGMKYLILLPGVIHVYIFVLESFLWDSPRGRKAFHLTEADAKATRSLAFNQGFYNLFLAVGVILGFVLWMGLIPVAGGAVAGLAVMVFSLGAIVAAGLVLIASAPAMWPAALLQIVPAVLALGLALGSVA